MQSSLITVCAALLLSIIHLNAARFRSVPLFPYRVWVLLAAGVSVSYVFLQFLLKLAQSDAVLTANGGSAEVVKYQAFLIALVGLVTFYGIEKALSKAARELNPEKLIAIFWARVGLFACYNIPIGYLLQYQLVHNGLRGLALYVVAIALHLIVIDSALLRGHNGRETKMARVLLAVCLCFGWASSAFNVLSEVMLAAVLALLAGAMILVVLKEELPNQNESHFPSFALGAFSYALLLIAL